MSREEKLSRSKNAMSYDLNAMLSKSKDTEKLRYILTLEERDEALESLWEEFGDVPMNSETECLEDAFYDFSAGTHRYDVWHWFDERHSKGVRYLLYREVESPLLRFLKEEVPFRLKECLELPEGTVSYSLIQACIDRLYDDSDIMFDYDRIDSYLLDVCREFGVVD